MAQISYRRHRFPPEIIQHAIWLYVRFTLGYRDVEELLAERGLDISYETVRRWVLKFGPAVARRLRQRRPRSSNRWHLDEMVVPIAGKRMYLLHRICWSPTSCARMPRHAANYGCIFVDGPAGRRSEACRTAAAYDRVRRTGTRFRPARTPVSGCGWPRGRGT